MFQRQEAVQAREGIEAALAEFLQHKGLRISSVRTAYGEDLTVKITFTKAGEMDPSARVLQQHAALYGLPADALGREFWAASERFVVTGLNTKARKMPVLARSLTSGKTYKFSTASVIRALAVG